jgi:hypothetical protein
MRCVEQPGCRAWKGRGALVVASCTIQCIVDCPSILGGSIGAADSSVNEYSKDTSEEM